MSDISSVSNDSTLGSLGLDSLMSVEVKQLLEREFDLMLSMKEIRGLTITLLREKASSTSEGDIKAVGKNIPQPFLIVEKDLQNMS